MNDEADKGTPARSSEGKGARIKDIPKTVPIDTAALLEKQKARQREAAQNRPWIAVVLVIAGLVLLYFMLK